MSFQTSCINMTVRYKYKELQGKNANLLNLLEWSQGNVVKTLIEFLEFH